MFNNHHRIERSIAKQTGFSNTGITLTKNYSHLHKQEETKIVTDCIDVLNALLKYQEKDVTKLINKLTNQSLKKKFSQFSKEYYYKLFRQNNLSFKVSEINDFFKQIVTCKELINPSTKLTSDEIKELDYFSLSKIIKMTNESKIFSQIMKRQKNLKLNFDYFNPESLNNLNSLIQIQNEDVKSLKAKVDNLESDLRIRKTQPPATIGKGQKINISNELANCKDTIAKLNIDIVKLIKQNQKLRLSQSRLIKEFNQRKIREIEQIQTEYQQKLSQAQKKIKQWTDKSKIGKTLLDRAMRERLQQIDIIKAQQNCYSQLNQKYQKLIQKESQRNQEKEYEVKNNIKYLSENQRLAEQLRLKEKQLSQMRIKQQQSQSLQNLKINQQLEKEQRALQRYSQLKQQKEASQANLTKHFNQLKQQKQRNERTLTETIKILKKQTEQAEVALKNKQEYYKDAQNSIITLRSEIEVKIKQLGKVKEKQEETKKDHKQIIIKLQSSIANLESLIEKKDEDIIKITKNSHQLQDQIKSLTSDNQFLKKQNTLNHQQSLINEYEIRKIKQQQEKRQNLLNEMCKQIQRQKDNLNAQIARLTTQSQDSLKLITNLKTEIKILKEQIEEDTGKVKEKDEQISKLTNSLEQIKGLLKQSDDRHKELEQTTKQINNHNITLSLDIQNITQKHKDLESKYNVLEKKLKDIENLPMQKQDSFQILQQQAREELKCQEENVLNVQHKQFQMKIKEQEGQLQKANHKYISLQKELQSANQKYYQLSIQNKSLQTNSLTQQQRIQQLQKQLEDKNLLLNSVLKQLDQQKQKERANSISQQRRIQQLQQQLEDKGRVLNNVLKQLEQYKQKESNRMSELLVSMKQACERETMESVKNDLEDQIKQFKQKDEKTSRQKQDYLKENKEKKQIIQRQEREKDDIVQKINLLEGQIQALSAANDKYLIDRQQEQRHYDQQIEILTAQINRQAAKSKEKDELLQTKDQQILDLQRQQQEYNRLIEEYKQKQENKAAITTQITSLQENLKEIKEQNEKLSQNLKNSKLQNDAKRIKINNLQYQNQNYKSTFNKFENQLESSRKHIKDIVKQQQNLLEKERKKHSLEINKLNEEFDILTKKNQQLEQLFQKMNESNEKLQKQLADKQQEIQTQKQALSRCRQEIASFYSEKKKPAITSDERTKLQNKIKRYEVEIDELNHQIQVLNQTLQDVNNMNNSSDIKAASEDSTELLEQIRSLEQRLTEKDEKINRYHEQRRYQQLRGSQKIKETTYQIDSLKERNKQLQESSQGLRQQIQKMNLETQKLAITIELLQKQLKVQKQSRSLLMQQQQNYTQQLIYEKQILQRQLNKVKMHCHNILKQKDLNVNLLFQHELLDYELEHKKFLKRTIEDHMRMTITKSKLLYRFDEMNKINFHKYFDNKENIVIIIKNIYGFYIAAYSEGSFAPQKTSDRDGLIIALNKQQVFTLAENCRRAITYDDYYLIFGNSEVRLRSQEKKVFSNFAISNSYYLSRGKKVADLLGGGPSERQVDIESYEIYQIEMIYG